MAPIYKSPNTILEPIYKKRKYYFGDFYKRPNTILSKNQNYWANNYSTKAQISFGKNDYIMLKAQNYSLAKTYFYILRSLTHGKFKLLIFQNYFFYKIYGNYAYFSIIN